VTVPVYPVLPGLAYSVKRTPTWSTRVQQSISGKETRVADYAYPRYAYELVYDSSRGGFLRQGKTAAGTFAELATLLGFFNTAQGSFGMFYFTDPDDNAVTGQSFGTGDGATTAFQLARALGGFVEPVQAVNGSPQIYIAGVLQSGGYTVGATGIVTFTTAPANGAALTWTGSYYWAARFADDKIDFEKFMASLWEAKSVKLISVKQ
jgi:uncharacterized protein (TIGR02217 family)